MDPNKTTPPLDANLADALNIPKGDVLIRKIGGPDGIHPRLGKVKCGRVYCLSAYRALQVIASGPGDFEPVFKEARTRIEAASKKAREKTQTKTTDKAV